MLVLCSLALFLLIGTVSPTEIEATRFEPSGHLQFLDPVVDQNHFNSTLAQMNRSPTFFEGGYHPSEIFQPEEPIDWLQTVSTMAELLRTYQMEYASRQGKTFRTRQSFFMNGFASLSEYVMSFVENSLEDLPSLPRLDAQECMKRSICEAHNNPKKYGLIGVFLQLLFPPYTKTEESNGVVSKYQLAARYGRQNNANCGSQYDGCVLNFLDLARTVVNFFFA